MVSSGFHCLQDTATFNLLNLHRNLRHLSNLVDLAMNVTET